MDYIDYEVEDGWLIRSTSTPTETKTSSSSTLQTTMITWKDFLLLTGKHLNLSKRIGKKIRVFRDAGNVYVSDHEFLVDEKYKHDKTRTYVAHISAKGEALMEDCRNRLKVYIGTEPLKWTIE